MIDLIKTVCQESESAEISFSSDVYDLDVIKAAALKFTDCCSFDFTLGPGEVTVLLTVSFDGNHHLKEIVPRFKNEVLDQDLRKKIFTETEDVRNVILANAFSNTSLIDS